MLVDLGFNIFFGGIGLIFLVVVIGAALTVVFFIATYFSSNRTSDFSGINYSHNHPKNKIDTEKILKQRIDKDLKLRKEKNKIKIINRRGMSFKSTPDVWFS